MNDTVINNADNAGKNSNPKLWDLVKEIRFAMLTTRQADGSLRSRPMTTQNQSADELNCLWFFTSRKGESVHDIQTDQQVAVTYSSPDDDSYVSVTGTASIDESMAKKEQLWSKMAEAWFPGGVSDPDLALVRVEIHFADYWDVKSNKMVQLLAMAKAVVTGKPPTDLGDHGKVQMR